MATLQKVVFGGSGREQIRARRARAASGRRRKPGWLAMRVAAAALLALVSIAAWALNTPSTRADGCPLSKICHPPELLNNDMLTGGDALYYATPSELTALEDLEQQALQNTLTDHNLPASDASAVLSWGRDDAEAELWNLVRQAATASNPTADQKGATAWLKDMASREGLQSANDAGLEYTKWAGLDVTKYTSLVNTYDADLLAGKDTTTDKTNLENFLKQAPYNYNNTNISQATGGYCAYKAPAPYQTEYSDTSADCSGTPEGFYACLAGCIPPTPSLDQFEKWGVADATNNLVSNPSFTQSAQNIALGLGLGAVVGSVAAGVGVSIALGGALAGTAFEAAVFPFASTPWYVLGTGGAYILPEAGAVAASGIGAIVGAVILFIVGTTLQAINLANYLDAPGQVAGYVEQEATKTYDPQSMLADQSGAGELYSLFVGATLPPPPPTGDTVMPFPETNCNASYYDSYNYLRLCLDPPPPPAPSLETDPQFIVTPSGGTPGAPHGTISWYDTATKVSNTAYAHGGWFVNTITSNGTQLLVMDSDGVSRPLVQSLRIHYTDWSGNEQFATLSNLPGSGYQFISVNQQSSATALNPSTCVTDKTCAISDTLEYVNSSGAKFSAKVIPPPVPVISSAAVSANPVEDSAATLTAAATSPVNAALSYRWQIEDKPLPTSTQTICMNAQMQVIPCPTPIVTVSGATATYKFPTSGTFAVTLVVTDSAGLYSAKSFTVTVGDVAPTLSLAPPCTAANTPAGCQAYAEPLGTATVLGGALNHVGAEDIETLDVNWGDGTTDDTVKNYACITPGCFSATMQFNFSGITTNNGVIALPFSASHTYVNPGAYTVTVKATDQSGAVTTTTATETALALTTTTISSSPNPSVVGQSVTLTASVTSALAGTPTG
ncbi:MAG: PKD domain-containing protein, partial [Chloroflexota bacterium]|nr:PKD domain-containing protein [Chloroflexota bacterium]